MSAPVRILFLADSHLGFDLPQRPRIARRRRGHDFLANYAEALQPALVGGVDLVVHGGDVFDSPRVPATLAYQAYEPLLRIAERGIPVFVVAGNHERSALPHDRFLAHRHVHVFRTPSTFVVDIRGTRVALSGFPYERRNVRGRFPELLERTRWRQVSGEVRLLCVHHCVEGATVGPGNFTFTTAADVVRCADLPGEFAAVLSGHIHRRQVLTRDLRRRLLVTPVLYPGSIERTSIAEASERKGYMRLEVAASSKGGVARWQFCDLYARPMIVRDLPLAACPPAALDAAVRAIIEDAPPDAIVRLRVNGDLTEQHMQVLAAPRLRELAPATMNVELSPRSALTRGGHAAHLLDSSSTFAG